jgi:hypothetical protein
VISRVRTPARKLAVDLPDMADGVPLGLAVGGDVGPELSGDRGAVLDQAVHAALTLS